MSLKEIKSKFPIFKSNKKVIDENDFISCKKGNFEELIEKVKLIPYGRNSNRTDFSLVLKENKFDESIRLIEDFELWYRLQNSGYKLGILKLPLYNYKTQLYQSKYFEQYLIYLQITKKNKQLILLKNRIFVPYFKKLYESSIKFYMKSLVTKYFFISVYYKLLY